MASTPHISTSTWTTRLQNIDKLTGELGFCVASTTIQSLRCDFLEPIESKSQEDENTALKNLRWQIRDLIACAKRLPSLETLEVSAHGPSPHSQAITECESKIPQFVAVAARSEVFLVRQENSLLKQLNFMNKRRKVLGQDLTKEVDYVRLRIARFRKGKALNHLKIEVVFRQCSSEMLKPIDYRRIYKDGLEKTEIQATRISRRFAAMSSEEIDELGDDVDCPICKESPSANPVSTELGTPSMVRTRSCCKKPYHLFCLLKWLEETWNSSEDRPATCPNCRAAMDVEFFIEALEMRTDELQATKETTFGMQISAE